MATSSQAELIIERNFESALKAAFPTFVFYFPNEDFDEASQRQAYAVVNYVYESDGSVKADQDTERFVGFVQLTLKYPKGEGSGNLLSFAGQIRNLFGGGYSFRDGSVLAVVHRTPSLGPVLDDPTRYVRPVRVPFFANNS